MKISLADPAQFKESINIISDLVNEATFNISKEGVELVAMDPANVAMVIFKMFNNCFSEYDTNDVKLSVNLSDLNKILRRVHPKDILTLELGDNQLILKIKDDVARTFNLPIIELEEKEQKIPDLKFPISIVMPSSMLTGAIEDADIVAESVMFEADKGIFTLFASGDLSQAKIEMKEGENIKIEASEKVKAKYSIEYLKKMIGGAKLSENVEVRFKNDYPLRLDFKVIDKMSLGFILAPRVDAD